jgi:hypothetical protein
VLPNVGAAGSMGTREKAMIELSAEQRQALLERQGGPVRLVDPKTGLVP